MIDIVIEKIGLDPWLGNYIILPVLIFMARIIDVSIGTMRVIFIMQGNHRLAPILGFFESFIWLVAVSQIMKNMDNIVSYAAFAAGFGTGTYIGIKIEEKLALGKVLIRIITRKEADSLIDFFRDNEFHFTIVPAEGKFGPVNVLFSVINREKLPEVFRAINTYNPKAFYTIESVKSASEYQNGETHQNRFSFIEKITSKRK